MLVAKKYIGLVEPEGKGTEGVTWRQEKPR